MKDINEILKISLDNIIEGCQIISPDFRYLYVNKSGARHGKSSVESLVGKRMVDVYPGIENTELFVQMKHSMDEKTPYRMENLFKFPDGSDGWFELRLDPVPEGLMILSVDITEEKGARNKLEELNKKLELKVKEKTDQLLDEKIKIEILLDSIGDGIIAIDRSWNITFSNEIASSISGWPKKEMIGRPFRDVIKFIREYDRKENISFIENAMVLGRMQQLQEKTSLIKKNGDEILIDDSASPIFNDDGKVVGATIIFRDASTTQEASNLRAGFQYASHQLNTPISKIMWSLELAIEEKDYDKRTKAIKEAYRSAQSVSKMSEQLFAVAQIDQDVVIPEYAEFELDVLIKDISKKSENSSFRSDVKISFNIANDIKKINSDKKMLSRILQELLDNAFKFNAQDGSIDISVRLIHGDIVFAIKDTGIGIVERDQALVFTKFFRGMNFDTSKISGAGLGLFISKAYTEILDGKIWFTSKPGETIFSFKLPLIHLETLK